MEFDKKEVEHFLTVSKVTQNSEYCQEQIFQIVEQKQVFEKRFNYRKVWIGTFSDIAKVGLQDTMDINVSSYRKETRRETTVIVPSERVVRLLDSWTPSFYDSLTPSLFESLTPSMFESLTL